MKEIITKSGKRIAVYDDVFPLTHRFAFESFCARSHFILGWADGEEQNRAEAMLHSVFSIEDLINSGLIDEISKSKIADEFKGYSVFKAILNLTTAADSHDGHIHLNCDKICLIYVNQVWDTTWHGDTMFYDESVREVEYASQFTPNRVVFFDPAIPHAIRPQSHSAKKYRFTLAIELNKVEE